MSETMTAETITLLENKRIMLGVTGSIAAYKAVDLASKLRQAGALVDVIMTAAAQKFVSALTFQAVTGRPVYTDMWQTDHSGGLGTHIAHVGLGEGAELFIIAPTSADTIARIAHGFANDLLSVTALAARCPVLVAPAMDGGMLGNAATQANLAILQQRGVGIIPPEEGHLASGQVGAGRLPDTHTLIGEIRRFLGRDGLLSGARVVVTAGGTREAIDPVRFISNRSSGKQGYALAQAALDAGADVTLISTAQLPVPVGATLIPVSSAGQMADAVLEHAANADILFMAAAVADFRPQTVAEQKIKKSVDDDSALTLVLTRTTDILQTLRARRAETGKPRVVVGFAAESQHLLENAQSKLERKGLDLLVANDISASDAGFEVDDNRVTILQAGGEAETLPLASKTRVAEHIIRRAAEKLRGAQRLWS